MTTLGLMVHWTLIVNKCCFRPPHSVPWRHWLAGDFYVCLVVHPITQSSPPNLASCQLPMIAFSHDHDVVLEDET